MKVNEVIEVISTIYQLGEKAPAVNLIGKPGIGKSAAVYQAAEKIGYQLGLSGPIPVVDIRLIHVNPVDLRGLPYPDVERGLAVWLQSGLLPAVEQYGEHLILFWDELTSAPPTVQAAAYQVIWERRLGDWKMAPNWIQVVAGNRLTDRGVTYKMPTPLANRMIHLPVEEDLDDWKKWALENGIDSRIIAFLNFRPQLLCTFDSNNDNIVFASPRSWEMLSNVLKCYPDPNTSSTAAEVVKGTVGEGAASEFLAFCRAVKKLPDIDEILQGQAVDVPSEPDILYALSSALAARLVKEAEHGEIQERLRNFIMYTMKMPDEFSVLTVRDALRSELVAQKLQALPEWVEWAAKYRKFIL
ncbi:MAG: ATPase [Desulfotomaculum sp.]|nr:ATPase [Desulfotomaculum sp.]